MKIPRKPPDYMNLLSGMTGQRVGEIMAHATPIPAGKYHHWDALLRRKPPESLTIEEWWVGAKVARSVLRKVLPMRGTDGWMLSYGSPDPVQEMLRKVDSQATGSIEVTEQITTPDMRDRYAISSLIEEAITSSQLEGASTTRRVAKDMIRVVR